MKRFLMCALAGCLLFLSACGSGGKVRCPYSSNNYQSYDLSTIEAAFRDAGFSNVTVKEVIGFPYGKVTSLTVDGGVGFTVTKYYDPGVPVVITYHPEKQDEPEPAATPEPTPEPDSPAPVDSDAARSAALAVDTQFRSIRATMEESYYLFLAGVKGNSFASDLEAYNAARALKDKLQGCFLQLMDVKCDGDLEYFDDYRLSNYTYVSGMIEVAEKSMQYFDDGLTSTLSDFQQAVSLVPDYGDECSLNQGLFLFSAGYSLDEIDAMLGNPKE